MAQTKTATATATETTNNYKKSWTPERRAAFSLQMKERWAKGTYSPVSKIGVDATAPAKRKYKMTKRHANALKKSWTPERKAAHSLAMKAHWQSPQGIAHHMAVAKGHSNSAIRKFDALAIANKQAVLAVIENAKAQLDAIALA